MTAYYLGDGIIVEVEITLDERTPLPLAHDIAQTIQYCFEGLYTKLLHALAAANLKDRASGG